MPQRALNEWGYSIAMSESDSLITRVLRWSERHTQLDMVYLASGSFWISVAQVGSGLVSLVILIAFANLLSQETYGLYRYILSIAGVLNVFSLTGMNAAVARAVARGEEGALRASVGYQLRWGLLQFAAFGALAAYYAYQGNSLFALSFLALGLFTPATLAFNTYGAYLEGRKEFRLASVSSVLSTLIYGIGMIAVLVVSGRILWIVFAYALATFFSTALFYFFTLWYFRPPAKAPKESLAYGRHLTLIGIMDPIVSQIDKIIVAHFWGPAQLAIYTLAMAIPARAQAAVKNLAGLGSPKFATKTTREIDELFYTRIVQGMLFGAVMTVGYVILSPVVFHYLLPKYLDSILYSQILSLSFLFAIPNRMVSLILVSQKLPNVILFNQIVLGLMKIFLFVICGIYGGVMGLVIAFVLSSFIGMLFNIAVWRWHSRSVMVKP